jgi:hypothetical protein
LQLALKDVQLALANLKQTLTEAGTLVSDGARILQCDTINSALLCTKGLYQLDATDTTASRKTAEFLANDLYKVMQVVGFEYFASVCLDGPNSCKRAMKILIQMPQCSHLLDQWCSTHAWHLGANGILLVPTFKEVYAGVLEIIAFVLKFPKIRLQMWQASCKALNRPAGTRHCSVFLAGRALISDEDRIREFFKEDTDKLNEVIQWIQSQVSDVRSFADSEDTTTESCKKHFNCIAPMYLHGDGGAKFWRTLGSLQKVVDVWVGGMRVSDFEEANLMYVAKTYSDNMTEIQSESDKGGIQSCAYSL